MRSVRLALAAVVALILTGTGCGKKTAPTTPEQKPEKAAPIGQPMKGYTQWGGGPTRPPGQAPPMGQPGGPGGAPAPVGE